MKLTFVFHRVSSKKLAPIREIFLQRRRRPTNQGRMITYCAISIQFFNCDCETPAQILDEAKWTHHSKTRFHTRRKVEHGENERLKEQKNVSPFHCPLAQHREGLIDPHDIIRVYSR